MECRNCLYYKKIEGNKRKNTDYGICQMMSTKRSNIVDYSLRKPNHFNNKGIELRKFISEPMLSFPNGFNIYMGVKSIYSSVDAFVDGNFYCAKYNIKHNH